MPISFISASAAFSAGKRCCLSAAKSQLQIKDECLECVSVYVCEPLLTVSALILRYTEEEIRQKVSTFRQMLMDKEGVITREGSHTQPV